MGESSHRSGLKPPMAGERKLVRAGRAASPRLRGIAPISSPHCPHRLRAHRRGERVRPRRIVATSLRTPKLSAGAARSGVSSHQPVHNRGIRRRSRHMKVLHLVDHYGDAIVRAKWTATTTRRSVSSIVALEQSSKPSAPTPLVRLARGESAHDAHPAVPQRKDIHPTDHGISGRAEPPRLGRGVGPDVRWTVMLQDEVSRSAIKDLLNTIAEGLPPC
jgi:hypothetical protein